MPRPASSGLKNLLEFAKREILVQNAQHSGSAMQHVIPARSLDHLQNRKKNDEFEEKSARIGAKQKENPTYSPIVLLSPQIRGFSILLMAKAFAVLASSFTAC